MNKYASLNERVRLGGPMEPPFYPPRAPRRSSTAVVTVRRRGPTAGRSGRGAGHVVRGRRRLARY